MPKAGKGGHTSEHVHPALGGLPTDAAAAAAAHPTLGGLAAESTLLAALRRLGLLSAALDLAPRPVRIASGCVRLPRSQLL